MDADAEPIVSVRPLDPDDHSWADAAIARHQGTRHTARLGELIDPLTLPGLVAEHEGRRIGVLTYQVSGEDLEVVTMHSEVERLGAGTALLHAAEEEGRRHGCRRLWLVTTNDNANAIDFYHRRGMRLVRVHEGAVDADRRLKPEIARVNSETGAPITDLLEFDTPIAQAPAEGALPSIAELNALDTEAFVAAVAPLFEGAPRFLARLAEARPYASDADLLIRAREIAFGMPEDEQIELLNAHPRIGADAATISRLSSAEQGRDDAPPEGENESWVDEELTVLNDAYERDFGFRFVIFVAGRPRREISPILERSLQDERESELRRGLDDVIYIAADRLGSLGAGMAR